MKKKEFEIPYGRKFIKFFNIMKLSIVISAFMIVNVQANSNLTYSQSARFTMKMHDATVKQVFDKVEKSSNYIFVYYKNALDLNRKVSVNVKRCSINELLNRVFESSNNSYKIVDRQVVVKERPADLLASNMKCATSELQQMTVSGRVTDSNGQPLIGVSVIVVGTTQGVVTDFDGKYSINVSKGNTTLRFSYVGYLPEERQIQASSVVDVVLAEKAKQLQEVVVVGYGAQKKESVVGSISQVSKENLEKSGHVTDLKQALTGQLPGLVTLTSSGEPGGTGRGESATNIFIRGMNTWNGGQPLILVDGAARDMSNLDVNEVESISILKDASATAVFGVEGANGVILITTKRGTVGKPRLSFSYDAIAKMLSKLPKMMDSYDALKIKDESIEREVVLNEPSWGDYVPNEIIDRYRKPQSAEYAEIYPNVNWQDALFKKLGMSHRASLDISGGTKKVSYFGSLAYLHEGDMFKKYNNYKGYDPNYDFDRFNFRSNLDFKLTKTTNLKVNLSGYYAQKNTNYNNEGSTGSADQWMWAAAYAMPPDLFLPQYSDGRFGVNDGYGKPNPVAAVFNLGVRTNHITELNSDYTLDQKLDFITKGLSAKASLFYDNQIKSQSGIYDGNNHVRGADGNTPEETVNSALYTGPDQDPSAYTSYWPYNGRNQFDWIYIPWNINSEVIGSALWDNTIPVMRQMIYQFQLNYARKFGKHNVSAMGVMKREQYAKGNMFPNYREDWVGRVTYDYNTTYFFEMNGAYNGSEQFGPGYRFAFFPSLALGWYVSNEKFWKIDQINRLKLRASTGLVGDDNVSSSRWLYATQLAYGGYSRLGQLTNSASPYTFYRESAVGNPNVHWEKSQKNNFGFDMGLFQDLISVTYDYFTENRNDILISGGGRSIPPFYGTTPPASNLGKVKSHGFEFEIRIDKHWNTGWHLWSSVSMTHTQNKIIFKDDPALADNYMKAAGFSIGQTKTQVSTGFYNNWDEVFASVPTENNDNYKLPGYYNLLDYNGDGVINSYDVVPYGYSEIPQNTYNFSIGGEYKGVSLMLQFYGVNNVSRNFTMDNFPGGSLDVVYAHVADYWSKTNENASSFLPRWKTPGENIGNYYIYDGSYLRLKTVELGYTFDNKWVKKMSLSSLRMYLNGENLFFWSKLPDDREVAWSGGSASQGTYPSVKRITFGVDLNF
ncbi:MAG: TonB-dependent receptor [Bacteroidota bacterium]|nr:TonB-dependent receptor [Bacteroidota bacterium]